MQLGKETTVNALGQKWTFGRMDLGVLKSLFEWIKEEEGDPFQDFERFIDKLPEAERGRIFRERQERRDELNSLNLQSPLAMRHLQSPRGIGYMALLLLRPHHKDITEQKAFEVMMALDPETSDQILENAKGKSAAKNDSPPAAA